MNTEYGTKWFTFYTKVRPWLALLSALTVTIDFIQYVDVYLATWWLMFYFILPLVLAALAFATFVKSYGDYREFVKFAEIVVCVETISFPILIAIQNYVNSGLDASRLPGSLFAGYLFAYFIWYRQNRLYFRRRVLPSQKSQASYLSDESQITTIYTRTTPAQKRSKKRYCKFCGRAIDSETKKCTGCGKQYFKIGFKMGRIGAIVLAVVCAISISLCIYLHVNYQRVIMDLHGKIALLESEIVTKELMVSEWKERSKSKTKKIEQLESEIDDLEDEISFYDRRVVIVIDNNSNLYHKYKCDTLQSEWGTESFWAYNTEAAKSRGHKPCPDCCG